MTFNAIGVYALLRRERDRTLRGFTQGLVSPWLSAVLYVFVFGSVLGPRLPSIGGVPYIRFVFPGILAMNVIQASTGWASSSLYFARFQRSIEEILVAPFSPSEVILGFVLGAVLRAVVVALGVMLVGVALGAVELSHPLLFLGVTVAVATVFALLGLIAGLLASNFEQLNVLPTFVVTPLSFLGGTFYSIAMLPDALQRAARVNPFSLSIDAMRYAMIGRHELQLWHAAAVGVGASALLGAVVWWSFRSGWRIRK